MCLFCPDVTRYSTQDEQLTPACEFMYYGASTLLVFAMQRLWVTVVGVYRQLLYRHCSEPLKPMAPVDRSDRARETVHIYGGT
jgi:hypothetical protein